MDEAEEFIGAYTIQPGLTCAEGRRTVTPLC